jgi:hypothetical protein
VPSFSVTTDSTNSFTKGDIMKRLILLSVVLLGFNFAASAGSAPDFFPSGPANLLPSDAIAHTDLWVGGDVAKGLFDGMTNASQTSLESSEVRLGKHIRCLHDSANKDIEYSCVLTVVVATGEAIGR